MMESKVITDLRVYQQKPYEFQEITPLKLWINGQLNQTEMLDEETIYNESLLREPRGS